MTRDYRGVEQDVAEAGQRHHPDLVAALQQLVAIIGDGDIETYHVQATDARVGGALEPTLADLLNRGYVEHAAQQPEAAYRLTPEGWLLGLRCSGAMEHHRILARGLALARALHALAGQDHDVYLDVADLAAQTDMPVGWVSSALAAQLLEALFPGQGFAVGFKNGAVRIPTTFGMAPVRSGATHVVSDS